MTVKVSAVPVDRVIASFRWEGWVDAKIVDSGGQYEIRADLEDVPAMLADKRTIKRKLGSLASGPAGRLIMATTAITHLLSILESSTRRIKR